MIRRTFLKALCASPLGLLLKPKNRSTEICNEALKRLGKPESPKRKRQTQKDAQIICAKYDPLGAWANECVEEFNRAYDKVIIKALS